MKTINYIKGDATKPDMVGNKIIAHICNDIGGMEKIEQIIIKTLIHRKVDVHVYDFE